MKTEGTLPDPPLDKANAREARSELRDYLHVRDDRHRLFPKAALVGLVAGLPGCGQKGPLVRPTRSPTTPVVIRTTAPADAPQQQPDNDAPKR